MTEVSHSPLAAKIHDNVTGPLGKGLATIGVNSPWKTGLFISGLTAGALYYLKPSQSFDAEGNPRPWVFFYDADKSGAAPPTYFPFWFTSLLVGYGLSLVI